MRPLTHSRGGCLWTCVQIPLQMFVYPPLVNRVGPVSALRIATSIGVFLIFFPLVRLFGKDTLGLQLATSAFMALRR